MKTRRAMTPMERAVDIAIFGKVLGDGTVPRTVTLRCPKCLKTKQAKMQDSDPEGTARVDIQCPECNGGDFDTPRYFDETGKELEE